MIIPRRASARNRRHSHIDFDAVARAAVPHLPTLVAAWLPNGVRCGADWRCGSIGGEPGQSLSITVVGPHAGRFRDFADDRVHGGDAIALMAKVFRISPTEAARRLAVELGVRAS